MHVALGFATVCLFIRTVFRSIELSGGFTGKLANSQVQFMVLDGVMVLLVCTCLTVMHPGFGFGDEWAHADFTFWKAKVADSRDLENYVPNGNLASEGKGEVVTQETQKVSHELVD